MAEPIANGAPYGHFGAAAYDDAEKNWSFERAISSKTALRILGNPRELVPSTLTLHQSERTPAGKEGPSRRREKQTQVLVQFLPELQPACNLLPGLARVSEAVENALACHDPAKGNLLAFGKLRDQRAHASVEIVAFPSGSTGSNLRVVQMQNQARGWKDTKTAWLSIPVLYGEEAVWRGPGAPIQSIDFNYSNGHGGPHLIVRLLTETVIFRPVLRTSTSQSSSSSRLDLNLLHRLPIENTGGVSHSDLCFNPWNSKQFAVVDQAGSWSVRELASAKASSYKQSQTSDLFSQQEQMQLQPMYDGWARVSWIGKPGNVVVCNRDRLFLCNIVNTTLKELPRITTHLRSGLGWNLDVAVVSSRDDYVILLTSDHILVYHMDQRGPGDLSPKIVACSKHYRTADDASMRLHLFQEEDEILIFVSSLLDEMRLFYRLAFHEDAQVTISHPLEVMLPPNAQPQGARVVDFHLHSAPVNGKRNIQSEASMASRHFQRSTRFYSILTLHQNLSVTQWLYYAEPNGSRSRILPPTWDGQLPKSSTIVLEDAFVVEDETSSSADLISERRSEPVPDFVQKHQAHMNLATPSRWTLSYERIARLLNDAETLGITEASELIQLAQEILQNNKVEGSMPLRTLRELTRGEINLSDGEDMTAALSALSILEPASQQTLDEGDERETQPNPSVGLISSPLAMPPSLNTPALADLGSVHEFFQDNWISPLSEELLQLAREAKQRLARRVASEITLASHVLRPEPPLPFTTADRANQSQSQSHSQQGIAPIRSPAVPSSRTTPSVYFDTSSQPHSPAHLSASASSSTVTSSSHPSTFSRPEIARLSKYTTFSKPPPALPRSLAKVLSHWQAGTDPASYDWSTTAKRFVREDEEAADSQLPDKERRRLQRRTERYVRRQRRQAEESRRQNLLSSQAPEIVSASQPSQEVHRRDRNLVTPSFGQSSQMVASQVVAGRHGGRKPVKKKRKSGF